MANPRSNTSKRLPRLELAENFSLPIDVVTQKLAWLGRTGSGKTYGAMKLAELMLEQGVQIIAFDIPGHWSGLRLGPKPFAIPVLGGPRGDMPLEASAGAAVADLVVDRGISVVLDVSRMDDPDLWRFCADFNNRFFTRKQASPSAVHVFYDECQELVPQEIERGQKDVFQSIHRQQKRGRVLGIGTSLISQRPQEVSKKVLEQAECVFAFQMSGRLGRERIADWVATKGFDDQDLVHTLPKLPVGTAHLWSPQWLEVSQQVRILKKRTPDVSATPKVGDGEVSQKPLSPVDLRDLRAAIEASVERAHQDDPITLRKRIAELEAQLRGKVPPPLVKVQAIEVPVLSQSARDSISQLESATAALSGELQTVLQRFGTSSITEAPARSPTPMRRPPPATPKAVPAHAPKPITRKDASASQEIGSGGLRRILTVLAQRPQGLSPRQIGVRAGLSSNSGTFRTYMSRARSQGWIEGRGDHNQITASGWLRLGTTSPCQPAARFSTTGFRSSAAAASLASSLP